MNKPIKPWFLSIDLEMEQPNKEIISVGVAHMSYYEDIPSIECKNFLITPSEPISPFIQELTGLKDSMYAWDKPRCKCFTEVTDYITKIRENIKVTCLNTKEFPEVVTWGQGDLHAFNQQYWDTLKQESPLGTRFFNIANIYKYELMSQGISINKPRGLSKALAQQGLKFEGEAHNSAWDAYNTLLLLNYLLYKRWETKKGIDLIINLNK